MTTQKDETPLLPCPLCGKGAKTNMGRTHVKCIDDECFMGWHFCPLSQWNRAAQSAPAPAQDAVTFTGRELWVTVLNRSPGLEMFKPADYDRDVQTKDEWEAAALTIRSRFAPRRVTVTAEMLHDLDHVRHDLSHRFIGTFADLDAGVRNELRRKAERFTELLNAPPQEHAT